MIKKPKCLYNEKIIPALLGKPTCLIVLHPMIKALKFCLSVERKSFPIFNWYFSYELFTHISYFIDNIFNLLFLLKKFL